jgi:hypothetical protein
LFWTSPTETLVVGEPVVLNNSTAFVYCPLKLDIQWCHAGSWKLCDLTEWKGEGIIMNDVAQDQFQKEFQLGPGAFMIPKIQGFVQVGNLFLFGNGFCWPLGSKLEKFLQTRSEGVVLEEGEENSSFPEFQPITHGGFGLCLQCSFNSKLKLFRTSKFFLAASEVILKTKSGSTGHGICNLVIDLMIFIMSLGQIMAWLAALA